MRNVIVIHLRNLAIFITAVALAFTGAEAVLDYQNKLSETHFSTISTDDIEHPKYHHLELELEPIENILSTESNFSTFSGHLVNPDATKSTGVYPLLKHLSQAPLDDAINIVVIGDSFTWGAYHLNRNNVFWRLLENELRNNGIKANVYGIAATGANAYEELAWLCETSLVEDLKPDLVIFGYVYNDAEYLNKIYSSPMQVNTSCIPDFFQQRFNRLFLHLRTNIAVDTMYTDKYFDNSRYITVNGLPIIRGKFYETYKNDFCEKLNDYAETVDFPVCVMTLPSKPDSKMQKEVYQPLEKLYSQYENINFYNSVKEFERFAAWKHRENYCVSPYDSHPGTATNKFYTDYIMDFIRKDFPHLIENNKGYEDKQDIVINEWLPYDISLKKSSDTTYSFTYPVENEVHTIHGITYNYGYYLTFPIDKKHIRFNFEDSITINSVKVNGNFENVELYYTCVNEKLGYDDNSVHEFNKKDGNTFAVSPDTKITSVLVSATFTAQSDRNVTLEFSKAGGENNE